MLLPQAEQSNNQGAAQQKSMSFVHVAEHNRHDAKHQK